MTAARTARSAWLQPALFWVFWMVAGYVGGIFYFLPMAGVHLLMGLDKLAGPDIPADFPLGMKVLAAMLGGAASGITIGLAQWLVLRTRLNNVGRWVIATMVGYSSIGLLPMLGNVLKPDWMDWGFTLILNGKMHWLARLEPDWPAAAWLPGAVTLTLFGVTLGLVQWLALRGRVAGAGWWIAFSAVGWAFAALLSTQPRELSVTLTWDLPLAVSGAGLVWLLFRSPPQS